MKERLGGLLFSVFILMFLATFWVYADLQRQIASRPVRLAPGRIWSDEASGKWTCDPAEQEGAGAPAGPGDTTGGWHCDREVASGAGLSHSRADNKEAEGSRDVNGD